MQPQATKATPEQLNYIAHWSKKGHTFPRNAVIPSDLKILPQSWSLPNRATLAVIAVMLAVVCAILKVAA